MNKTLAYARALYAWKVQKSPVVHYAPEDVSIELTNACNFKCSFCPQSDSNHFNVVARSVLTPERSDMLF